MFLVSHEGDRLYLEMPPEVVGAAYNDDQVGYYKNGSLIKR